MYIEKILIIEPTDLIRAGKLKVVATCLCESTCVVSIDCDGGLIRCQLRDCDLLLLVV
jgi:hypothetical protein